MLCSCARVASTICSGHPSARAAAASFSMTCSLFFSLLLAVSMRQVDIASKAAFTALRASSESPGTDIELKVRGFTPADLFCMAVSPLTDRRMISTSAGFLGQKASSVLLKISPDMMVVVGPVGPVAGTVSHNSRPGALIELVKNLANNVCMITGRGGRGNKKERDCNNRAIEGIADSG